ncbi:hypothetical protein Fmac_020707 [Flemingia macrophylla]|uniref:G protein gamma domain-containing protein n=1 Tax=Flemingia macrophylla TaxID=520843 RepID=A0ABD1LUU7_9FABA
MFTSSMPSPLPFPDLYGKRRQMAKLHMLEREISFLQEELKSSEGLQPASRCCKEINDFMMTNSDPLLPTSRKNRRSCSFWKWLWNWNEYADVPIKMRFLALTSLGSTVGAVMGALDILTRQVAVPIAKHAIAAAVVFHLSIAALWEDHIAAKIAHAVAKVVAFSQVAIFGGLFPLAAVANAHALAPVQPAPRFAHVAVVQIPVGTLAFHVACINIFLPKKNV